MNSAWNLAIEMRSPSNGDSISPRGHLCIARVAAAALLCLFILGAGCSMFHHESPQQQFMDSLNRGNSAQASELWHHMSAKDRANFSHNIGFETTTNKDDLARSLLKHQQEQEAKENADDPDVITGADDGADSDSPQTETPGIPAGSLFNLSQFGTAPSSPTITEIGPR